MLLLDKKNRSEISGREYNLGIVELVHFYSNRTVEDTLLLKELIVITKKCPLIKTIYN